MANLVIVADMVRGFCEEGRNLYVGPTIREIIPRIRELLEREKAAGSHIVFVCDTHEPDDKEFEMFPPHCIRGTEEPDVIPELAGFADEVIPKPRYSPFFQTNLDEPLAEPKPDQIIILGHCPHILLLYPGPGARHLHLTV